MVPGTLYNPNIKLHALYLGEEFGSREFHQRIGGFLKEFPSLGPVLDMSLPVYLPPDNGFYVGNKRQDRLLSKLRKLFSLPLLRFIVSPLRPGGKAPLRLKLVRRKEAVYLLFLHFVVGNLLVGSDHALLVRGRRGSTGHWVRVYGTRVVALDIDLPAAVYRGLVEEFLYQVRMELGLMGFYGLSYSGRLRVYYLFQHTLRLGTAHSLGVRLKEAFLDILPPGDRSSYRGFVESFPTNPQGPGKSLFLPLGFVSDGLETVSLGYPTPLSSLVTFLEQRLNPFGEPARRQRSLSAPPKGRRIASRGSTPIRVQEEASSPQVQEEVSSLLGLRDPSAAPVPSEGSFAEDVFQEGQCRGHGDQVCGLGGGIEGSLGPGKGAEGLFRWPLYQEPDRMGFRSAVQAAAFHYLPGSRQNLTLGLAAFGAELGLSESEVLRELEPLLEGDEERDKRVRGIRNTFRRIERGQRVAWRHWMEGVSSVKFPERVAAFLQANADLCDGYAANLGVSPRVLRLAVLILAEVVSKSIFGRVRLGYDALSKRWRASKRDVSAAIKILLGKGLLVRVEKGFFTPLPEGRGKIKYASAYELGNSDSLPLQDEREFFLAVVRLLR